jgi:proline dehydrogenase
VSLWNRVLAGALPWVPRPLIAAVARRYVAGPSAAEVLSVVAGLERSGLEATVDLLGENVSSREEAASVREEYLRLLEAFAERRLRAHLSVKLTHLGLRAGEELARDNTAALVEKAESQGSFVRIDMEDSSTTDAALRVYRLLRSRWSAVGLAIQAYLRRSEGDVRDLLPLVPNLRLCKGIYDEPPALAWQDYEEVRRSFLRLVRLLLEGGGTAAIATHDPYLIARSQELIRNLALGSERHEFEMLLGVGHQLRPAILAASSKLRIYCPYGSEWYDYSLRRLRENPKIAGYILKSLWRGPRA